MPQLTLRTNIQDAAEVYERDYDGKPMRSNADRILVHGVIDLASSGITVHFAVTARVKRTLVDSENDPRQKMLGATLRVLGQQLERRSEWDIFKAHEVSLDHSAETLDSPLPPDKWEPLKVEVEVSHALIDHLKPQAETDRTVRKAFEQAVDKLEDLANATPSHHETEIRALWGFVEDCLDCGDVGHNYSWYREKRAVVGSSFSPPNSLLPPQQPFRGAVRRRVRLVRRA